MSEYAGKLLVCKRCGLSTFCPPANDGGYNIAKGWFYRNIHYIGGEDFCPRCNKEYDELIKKFMSERNGENAGRIVAHNAEADNG